MNVNMIYSIRGDSSHCFIRSLGSTENGNNIVFSNETL